MANNIMNIMSVSFNSQSELEDFLNRVKGKDDDGEKDFRFSLLFLCRNHCKSYRHGTGCSHGRP